MSYRLTMKTDHNSFPYGETIHTVELVNEFAGHAQVVARELSVTSLDEAKQKFKESFRNIIAKIEQEIPDVQKQNKSSVHRK